MSRALRSYGHLIKSVTLFCDDGFLEKFLEFAPSTLPQLTSIWLTGLVRNGKLIAGLMDRCTGGLRVLRLQLDHDGDDAGSSDLDQSLEDGWGDAKEYFGFGQSSVAALFDHASTIEAFHVENPGLSSANIHRFLCSASKLEEFDIRSETRPGALGDNSEACLKAADIDGANWACTSLKFFGCPIGGFTRSDFSENIHYGLPPWDHLENLDLHRRVYTQLGRLTYLRELLLGIRYETNHRDYSDTGRDADRIQFDCLAMSLQSGLGLLCDLKELCEVGMKYMYVVFDQEERLWAAKHWPNAYIDFGEGLEPLLTADISILLPCAVSTIHHGLC
ncbi:hypothetical protein BGZ96_010069 [Linnemannia gamsii]|uniref:Uncharacterized protein n=1 Tax=Linnemannia gamsii TaxID=64522 RepID=A0ABQ7KCV4_9FUNG|nr:hypothetical protein BGZ96_010069 [Linnemannia gamsii]